jgi:hypothetical protein
MSFESHDGNIVFGEPKHFPLRTLPVAKLPISELSQHIAILSRCVCGDTLSLGNHTLTRMDGIVKFDGVFVCRGCNDAFSARLKNAIGTFWGRTRKVEASVTGIKYEKDGSIPQDTHTL